MKKQILFLVTAIAAVAGSAYADDPTETFRTLAGGTGIYQNYDTNSKPIYGVTKVYGHDLVAAAMGVQLGTVTNPVLALVIDCGSTTASLVAWDKVTSNVDFTIATSTSLDVVQQQDRDTNAFPNRERFVAQFTVLTNGTLGGGYLTMAGRLSLNPTNGCPRAVKVEIDPLDHVFYDFDGGKNLDDTTDKKDILRAGVGHFVGVVNVGTNKFLLPFEAVSIRRQLD